MAIPAAVSVSNQAYPPPLGSANRHKLRPIRTWTVMDLRSRKPRQEICAPLKWFCFLLNFIGFLLGVTCLALGIYLWTKDPRSIGEVADVLLNPAVVLTACGLTICGVALCGLFGALRDNVCLLKTFALCIFLGYALVVASTFALFMLFYTDTAEGITAQSVFLHSIRKYHTNRNIADFVDYIQEQLECCGSAASAGYRDWQLSEQFSCNQTNLNPERCGVPFSCCRRSVVSGQGSGGSLDPLVGSIRSIQCWQNVQTKSEHDLEQDIYLRGCLQPMKGLFDKYGIHFGAFVAMGFIPVCLGVCLSQCLARQIDYQRYLLSREERKAERRMRRERHYREQIAQRRRHSASAPQTATSGAPLERDMRPRRILPSRPAGASEMEAAALAAAMEASKKQWEMEEKERKRRRTKSASPVGGAKRQRSEVSHNPTGETQPTPIPLPPTTTRRSSTDLRTDLAGQSDEVRRRKREERRQRRQEELRAAAPLPAGFKTHILRQSDFQ